MPFPFLSYPYPPSKEGYWSPVTSTLNWCEEDYYATVYSAEIVNALTNLMFMYLAWKGIYSCITQGHDQIFFVSFIGYLVVGVGSFLFHSTLKYPMQLVDELSMIYTTCIMFYATFSHGKPVGYGFLLAVFLVSLAAFITGYYHYLQDPTFHQNAYAVLTAIVLLRSMYVMEVNIRPLWKAKKRAVEQEKKAVLVGRHTNGMTHEQKAEQTRRDERDERILRTMWTMVAYGLTIFIGGFAVWNLDNKFCPTLRRWRRSVGLPWGILLEGHGWWHLMTGIGAYFYITWGIWLRHSLNGRQDEFDLVWPRLITSIPVVVRRTEDTNGVLQQNGHANGVAKKNS